MFEEIRDEVQKLIALYEGAESSRKTLLSQLDDKQAEIESYRKQIKELESQIDVLRLREAFTTETTNTTAAKEKIDKLVAEIDRCLALLSK